MKDDLPNPHVSATPALDIDHYPVGLATWDLPTCLRCGGECVFYDGVCAPCWQVYQGIEFQV